MHLRKFITAAAIALLPIAASAATFIVPAAGSASGANGSQWKSELTLHNSGPQELTASIKYQTGTTTSDAISVAVPARSTKSLDDIVKTSFHREGTIGALIITVDDRDAIRLALGSRTYNQSESGEFGQDIPAVNTANASVAGDVNVLTGPSSAANYRFNFGLVSVAASTVHWEVLRADGTIAATKDVTYAANEHVQYNDGVHAFLGVDAKDNDAVQATVTTGRAIFYGSAVNGATGDPTFVPGVKTRDAIRINFIGIDVDENGSVDLNDANHDGVLDTPMDVVTSMFPSIFRVVAQGEFGEAVTLEIVSAPSGGAVFLNADTIQMGASGDLKGSSGELLVRATAQGSSSVLTIPLKFR